MTQMITSTADTMRTMRNQKHNVRSTATPCACEHAKAHGVHVVADVVGGGVSVTSGESGVGLGVSGVAGLGVGLGVGDVSDRATTPTTANASDSNDDSGARRVILRGATL